MKDGSKQCVETITENSKTGEKMEKIQLSNLDQSNFLTQFCFLVIYHHYLISPFFYYLNIDELDELKKQFSKLF